MGQPNVPEQKSHSTSNLKWAQLQHRFRYKEQRLRTCADNEYTPTHSLLNARDEAHLAQERILRAFYLLTTREWRPSLIAF